MNHKMLQRLKTTALAMIATVSAMTFTSCNDEITMESRFTFKGELIADYLVNNPDKFSNFTRILEKAKIGRDEQSLGSILKSLSTYGSYTCFAPVNEALDSFLMQQYRLHEYEGEKTGITSPYIEDLSDSMALEIAKNHIIEEGWKTIDVNEGAFPSSTMNGRAIKLKPVPDSNGRIQLQLNNNTSIIIEQDIEKENGYVQVVDRVLSPSSKYISELVNEQEEFSIFYDAILLTGLDSLLSTYIIDPDYDPYMEHKADLYSEATNEPLPKSKVQRYTLLIEPNTLFHNKGIKNIDDLIEFAKKWYGDTHADNYKSKENALYKFVAYHIIDRRLFYEANNGPGGFIMEGYEHENFSSKLNLNTDNFDTQEYYETMMPYTMIKVTKPYTNPELSNEIVLNYAQEKGTVCKIPGMEEHINVIVEDADVTMAKYSDTLTEYENDALNGTIYTIDRILIYNEEEMAGNILNERIRIDVSALFPELTNNDVRWDRRIVGGEGTTPTTVTYIPSFGKDQFCKDFRARTEYTEVFYLRPHETWGGTYANFQGDELIVEGNFDFEYRIPNVPEGTYELRFGYPQGYARGVSQFYVDGKVAGIPVDMYWYADGTTQSKLIGWFSDEGLTEEEIRDKDKAMRNHGYMKGPASIILEDGADGRISMRAGKQPLRKIIGTYYLNKREEGHWLRFKNISDGDDKQFDQDYLEIVPTTVINNSQKPEDIN